MAIFLSGCNPQQDGNLAPSSISSNPETKAIISENVSIESEGAEDKEMPKEEDVQIEETEDKEMPKKEDVQISIEGIADTFTLTQTSTFSLVITNNTDKDIEFGGDYSIQKFENENWATIPVRFSFNLLLYKATPGSSVSISCTLDPGAIPSENNTYEYLPGKYRIVKNVIIADDKLELYYEFEIAPSVAGIA
jgi:hypothetical protein